MTETKSAIMTVFGKEAAPSLADAAAQLGLDISDLNQEFGVVAIDPQEKLYAVEVKKADGTYEKQTQGAFHGPYSNPMIAPFRSEGESDDQA